MRIDKIIHEAMQDDAVKNVFIIICRPSRTNYYKYTKSEFVRYSLDIIKKIGHLEAGSIEYDGQLDISFGVMDDYVL